MGDVETCEPQTLGLSVNSIADSLIVNFLVYFADMSSYFSMKPNKRKVRKCLKCVKKFSRRFDLTNGKYLSIFLVGLCKNCQGYIFCLGYQFLRKDPRENSSTLGR